MKIVWHMPTLRAHSCGLSIRALRLAGGLRERGCHVTFVAPADKTDITGDSIEGMPVRRIALERARALHWCLQARRRAKAARLMARRIGTDWDVMISCQPEVVEAYARLTMRPPVVFVCGSSTLLHEGAEQSEQSRLRLLARLPYAIDRLLKRRNERRAVAAADLVVFDSLQTRDRVIADYNMPPTSGHTVHGGVDAAVFQPADHAERQAARVRLGLDPDGVVVVWTGRLSPEKNLELLIKSLPRCRRRPRSVLVVGSGPKGEELARLAKDLDLGNTVQFVGEQEDVRPYLHAADIFAFPSRSESFGGALVEGLACGLPAVGLRPDGRTIRNANCEIIEHGRAGLLVDAPRPGDFAAALDRLTDDAGMREECGAAGRRWVAENFTWNRAAVQFSELVSTLAKDRPGRAGRLDDKSPRRLVAAQAAG